MRIKEILAADQDVETIDAIRARLERRGEFRVHIVATADDVLRCMAAAVPDALLLDTMLPDVPAQELCRTLRSRRRTEAIPCIMIGHLAGGLRPVDALEFGADDFLFRPVDACELEARLRAVLRRRAPAAASGSAPVFHGTRIEANFDDVSVRIDAEAVSLTRRELLLLRALVDQCNHTLSRETLLARVWGSAARDCRLVDSAMWKLRKKLRSAGSQIQTVVGFGYRFNEPLLSERGEAS